jgi:predicted dehydrogenase
MIQTSSLSRRRFIRGAAGGAAAAATLSAKSYSRVPGANDRIHIGFLGCGARGSGHRRMVEMSFKDKNLAVVAVCDLWSVNRSRAAADCRKRFNEQPKELKYSEEMLKLPDLDAVMIATGDHQHGRLLAEVVAAGKDCYVEKPMALDVEEAKLARAAVLASKQVVQNGVQWLSDPYQIRVRELIRSGKLGHITKIEQVWGDNNHRWHDPGDPDVAAIREEDTDWNRWLLGKPYRPFDPWAYFEFRIFRDFSGGITSQWMSHGIELVHFYTDTAIPDSMVAAGGILQWRDIRQNPDTIQALASYDDARMLYSYSSTYANRFGDYSCIRGTDATLYAQGGEGSPRWFLVPEVNNEPVDLYGGFEDLVRKGRARRVTLGADEKLPPTGQSDDSKAHLDNWIDCMRARNPKTNDDIHRAFWHSVGTAMATEAYRRDKKLYWDRRKEEIVDRRPA